MQLIVRSNEVKSVECDNLQTITELKATIAKSLNVCDISNLNLYFNSKPMENDAFVEYYDLFDYAAIDINFGIKGGKTHGRIGLAGKVRNQTPKVEKQEKPKALTGRAKKRMQYNRRFVNVANSE